jgi:hypothetical protein
MTMFLLALSAPMLAESIEAKIDNLLVFLNEAEYREAEER